MKPKFCFLVTAVMFVIVTTSAYSLVPNMVAAWTFEEGSGETTADITGNGHVGTVVGEVEWAVGKNGKGLKIMDVSQYVMVEDAEDLHFGTDDFTFTAWIKLEEITGETSVGILSKRDMVAGNGKPTLVFLLDKATTVPGVDMRDDKAGMVRPLGNTVIKEGQWYHIAAVKDAKRVTYYVDGKEDGGGDHGFTGGFTTTESLYIGVHHYGTTWNCPLLGTIDEVGIFNRALTGNEIESLKANIAPVEASGKLAGLWGNIKSAE